MAYLFVVSNNRVTPNTETLLIEPFKSIWERDETVRKELAILEFTYIEFMTSGLRTNPYKGYEKDKRMEVLKNDLFRKNGFRNWEQDSLIIEGMNKIEQFQTEASPNYTLYLDAQRAKEELQRFLREFDANERTKSNSLVLKPGDITKGLLDIDKVATSLNSLNKKIEEDLYEEVRTRANKEISMFAKPEFLNR